MSIRPDHAKFGITLIVTDEKPIVLGQLTLEPAKLRLEYHRVDGWPPYLRVFVHGPWCLADRKMPGGTLDLTRTPEDQRPDWIHSEINYYWPPDWPR